MAGLVVNTNMNAVNIESILSNTNGAVSSSLEKLSSGLRINTAADDPAGYAVANSFKAKIASMQVGAQNAGEAQSMLQTADGAYTQINDIMVQMKSLATEAASGQTSDSNLTGEFQALQSEIDNIATSTQYNGKDLIDGTLSSGNGGVTFQVGALNVANNQLNISFDSAKTTDLKVDKGTIQVDTQAHAQAAMDALDTALTSINMYMSNVGALQNELQYTVNNLTTGIDNFTSSASTIEDVNMATEVSTLTKNQILQQTAMGMLAQANSQPQSILKLIQ